MVSQQYYPVSTPALIALRAANNANEPIYIASISIVEIIYLIEKAKLPKVVLTLLKDALTVYSHIFKLVPLSVDIAEAVAQIPRDVVPDMSDRIIAATALQLNLPLVTSDHKIRATTAIQTIW